ncbi:MAG: hypothetical protein JXA30_09185 [Deltaproteobacteria bacterium]|nr:hypothetical protein [Deltaproteobacteria bacterium]
MARSTDFEVGIDATKPAVAKRRLRNESCGFDNATAQQEIRRSGVHRADEVSNGRLCNKPIVYLNVAKTASA